MISPYLFLKMCLLVCAPLRRRAFPFLVGCQVCHYCIINRPPKPLCRSSGDSGRYFYHRLENKAGFGPEVKRTAEDTYPGQAKSLYVGTDHLTHWEQPSNSNKCQVVLQAANWVPAEKDIIWGSITHRKEIVFWQPAERKQDFYWARLGDLCLLPRLVLFVAPAKSDKTPERALVPMTLNQVLGL
jgi:hypothetical protein